MQVAEGFPELREALYLRAALVNDFLPRDLLQEVVPAERADDILLQAQLMSALRADCTIEGETWQLRPIPRRKVLSAHREGLDLPDTEIGSALRGENAYAPETLGRMIENTVEIDMLARAVATLEQAGPAAPGHGQLLALSSKLDRARRDRATDNLLGDGFVGRDNEVDRLLAVLDTPERSAPLHTLHIQGLPGVGKTYLLEQLGRLCRARPRIVLVRLDFDRSALGSGSPEAIFAEMSRQIGSAMPEVSAELHNLRMRSAERRTRIGSETSGAVPFDLVNRMIDILAASDRQLVLLVDTLEVLHGQGATFIARLMEDLDRLADKERIDISVISAGRGAIFAEDDKRLHGLIYLEALDAEIMRAILTRDGVPEDQHDRIIELSGGNPLRLKLVTRAFQEDGATGLSGDGDIRAAETGYLYRAVLSRVPTDIRQLAAEGLILPELGAWEVMHILVPALSLGIEDADVADLLEMLEMQRWMVRPTSDGKLAHVPEVRREILEITYSESRAACARINARAAEVLEESDPVRALYHRLQLSRESGAMPDIDPTLARQLSNSLLEDLPSDALDAVLRARGARSRMAAPKSAAPQEFAGSGVPRMMQHKAARASSEVTSIYLPARSRGARLAFATPEVESIQPDAGALSDLRNMLDARELGEASFLMRQVFAAPVGLEGEAAMLALAHQWLTGHWSMAHAMLDVLPDTALDHAVQSDMGLAGLVTLGAWAEFRFDRLCERMGEPHIFDAVQHALSLTQRSGMFGAALSLTHLVVAGTEMASEYGGVGTFEPYLPEAPMRRDREMAQRANARRAEFGLDLEAGQADPISMSPGQFAQVMAPLNPYAAPLGALLDDLADGAEHKILGDFRALGAALPELGSLFVPDLEGVSDASAKVGNRASEVWEVMAAMGLTAEVAGGYVFFSPVPDLPTIARAADRWQQATLGRWAFGRRKPDGWENAGGDALSLVRAERLNDAANPVDRALNVLRLWDDPARPEARTGAPTLRRRLARPLAAVRNATTLANRVAVLEGTSLPAVLRAPVAVLAERNVPSSRIFADP